MWWKLILLKTLNSAFTKMAPAISNTTLYKIQRIYWFEAEEKMKWNKKAHWDATMGDCLHLLIFVVLKTLIALNNFHTMASTFFKVKKFTIGTSCEIYGGFCEFKV